MRNITPVWKNSNKPCNFSVALAVAISSDALVAVAEWDSLSSSSHGTEEKLPIPGKCYHPNFAIAFFTQYIYVEIIITTKNIHVELNSELVFLNVINTGYYQLILLCPALFHLGESFTVKFSRC
jgi:hypothetical protein